MSQTISVNPQDLLQSLKDASTYTLKTPETDNAMSYVLLTVIPKTKKLAVIGCDGLGYYERQINASIGKGKAILSGKGFISISPKDMYRPALGVKTFLNKRNECGHVFGIFSGLCYPVP